MRQEGSQLLRFLELQIEARQQSSSVAGVTQFCDCLFAASFLGKSHITIRNCNAIVREQIRFSPIKARVQAHCVPEVPRSLQCEAKENRHHYHPCSSHQTFSWVAE